MTNGNYKHQIIAAMKHITSGCGVGKKNNIFFALVTQQTVFFVLAAQRLSNYKCVVGPPGWRDELPRDPQRLSGSH